MSKSNKPKTKSINPLLEAFRKGQSRPATFSQHRPTNFRPPVSRSGRRGDR